MYTHSPHRAHVCVGGLQIEFIAHFPICDSTSRAIASLFYCQIRNQ